MKNRLGSILKQIEKEKKCKRIDLFIIILKSFVLLPLYNSLKVAKDSIPLLFGQTGSGTNFTRFYSILCKFPSFEIYFQLIKPNAVKCIDVIGI